jgi:hypothetical protein
MTERQTYIATIGLKAAARSARERLGGAPAGAGAQPASAAAAAVAVPRGGRRHRMVEPEAAGVPEDDPDTAWQM